MMIYGIICFWTLYRKSNICIFTDAFKKIGRSTRDVPVASHASHPKCVGVHSQARLHTVFPRLSQPLHKRDQNWVSKPRWPRRHTAALGVWRAEGCCWPGACAELTLSGFSAGNQRLPTFGSVPEEVLGCRSLPFPFGQSHLESARRAPTTGPGGAFAPGWECRPALLGKSPWDTGTAGEPGGTGQGRERVHPEQGPCPRCHSGQTDGVAPC